MSKQVTENHLKTVGCQLISFVCNFCRVERILTSLTRLKSPTRLVTLVLKLFRLWRLEESTGISFSVLERKKLKVCVFDCCLKSYLIRYSWKDWCSQWGNLPQFLLQPFILSWLQTFENFKQSLPYTECRYAIYDQDYKTNDGRPASKLWFISWFPSNSTTYHKMAYTSAKTKFREAIPGVFDTQVSSLDELEANLGLAAPDEDEDKDFDF